MDDARGNDGPDGGGHGDGGHGDGGYGGDAATLGAVPPPGPAYGAPEPVYGQPEPVHAAPAPVYAAPAPVYGAPAAPAKSRKVLVWIIVASAAFLLLAIGAVVTVVLLVASARGGGSGSSGAEALAKEYVQMVADGNAKRANEIARVDTSDENNIMLTDAVLSKAERITNVSVSEFYASGAKASARVSYKLGSKGYKQYLDLDRDSDGWYVSRGLVYAVSNSLPYLSDAEFGVPGLKGVVDPRDYSQVAYPAVYKLKNPNKFIDVSAGATVTVGREAKRAEGITVGPSQAYLDTVADLLKKEIDECRVHTTDDDLYDCGLTVGFPSRMSLSSTSFAVTVAEYPTVKPSADGSLGDFTVVGGAITAHATGTDYSGAAATDTVDVTLPKYVRAEIVGGKVALR